MNYAESSIQDIIDRRGYRKEIEEDKFSLFISNYPSIAKYLSSRIGNSKLVLAELCCSIGMITDYSNSVRVTTSALFLPSTLGANIFSYMKEINCVAQLLYNFQVSHIYNTSNCVQP